MSTASPLPQPAPSPAGSRLTTSQQRTAQQRQPQLAAPVGQAVLAFCNLGSGSSGNCSVLRHGHHSLLIDAGFGTATTRKRLSSVGIAINELAGVCVTHMDRDHFKPNWIPTLVQWQVPIYIHAWHRPELESLPHAERLIRHDLIREFDADGFEPLPGLSARAIRLKHDQQGTTGFLFEAISDASGEAAAGGNVPVTPRRVGFATDLGHVPAELIERFADADLIALESNYDPVMQRESTRPMFLKRRIMGQAGHLSNEEAFDALQKIYERSSPERPQHIVLLHRSGQCNSIECIQRVFSQNPQLAKRLTFTEQRKRTRWIQVEPVKPMVAQQLTLGW